MTPDELMAKWRGVVNSSKHIYTWTEDLTLAYLAELASNSKCALEFGTYHGASAFVMLKANPNLLLWCVDSWQDAGSLTITQANLREFIVAGRCELLTGDSGVAAKLLNFPGTLDFVFVDNGHESWQVKKDIEDFLPMVRSGGRLVGHDFEQNPFNNVAEGVIASGISYTIPVPRLWEHIK